MLRSGRPDLSHRRALIILRDDVQELLFLACCHLHEFLQKGHSDELSSSNGICVATSPGIAQSRKGRRSSESDWHRQVSQLAKVQGYHRVTPI